MTLAEGGFGPLLRDYRVRAGLSQNALARRAEIDPGPPSKPILGQPDPHPVLAQQRTEPALSQRHADRVTQVVTASQYTERPCGNLG